eukprot:Sspe_Gene.18887::Locus_6825_Transcript_2_2_Confidence_0.600_Length_2428::g.18887::m.18887
MVDPHHAVLVRNTDAGSLELVTEHGLFFPRAFQEVVEVQEKIVLEKYQTVVCKDAMGRFYYASGNTDLPEGERPRARPSSSPRTTRWCACRGRRTCARSTRSARRCGSSTSARRT